MKHVIEALQDVNGHLVAHPESQPFSRSAQDRFSGLIYHLSGGKLPLGGTLRSVTALLSA